MKYEINTERVLLTQMGDEGVMMDLSTNEYLSLNETYYRIMVCLSEGKTVEETVDILGEEFEVSREECDGEVRRVVSELVANKYLV